MKSLKFGAVAISALFGCSGLAHSAGLLDGNFSTPYGGPSYTTYFGGSTFGPWTVTGGSVDLIGGYWQAPTAGGGSVDLDGDSPGGITQTFSLGAGAYNLKFSLSGNPDGAPATKTVDVTIDGVSKVFTYKVGANTHANMGYVPESLRFLATGPSSIVSFVSQDVGTPYGPAVGGLSITAVPEPATWALMIFGVAGVGATLRGSRRASSGAARLA